MPLDIVLSEFKKHNLIIDWTQLIDESLLIGWSIRKTKEKIEIGIRDSELSIEEKNILYNKISLYLKEKNNNE